MDVKRDKSSTSINSTNARLYFSDESGRVEATYRHVKTMPSNEFYTPLNNTNNDSSMNKWSDIVLIDLCINS